jgi:hypothetical protein
MAANGEHVSVACAARSFSSMPPSSVQFISALLGAGCWVLGAAAAVCRSQLRCVQLCTVPTPEKIQRTDKISEGARSGLTWS